MSRDGTPTLRLTPADCADLRAALHALRDLACEAVPPGLYRCRVCGGVGPWPSQVPHGPMPGDGPQSRPCRVARGLHQLVRLAAWINAHEGRPMDAPVVGGEAGDVSLAASAPGGKDGCPG